MFKYASMWKNCEGAEAHLYMVQHSHVGEASPRTRDSPKFMHAVKQVRGQELCRCVAIMRWATTLWRRVSWGDQVLQCLDLH